MVAALHLATEAGGGGLSLGPEIPAATVRRAIAIVDSFVVPVAQAWLGPVSTPAVERDARRVIAYLRETTSTTHLQFERRLMVRAWQHSMTVPRLDAALGLLQQEGLLVALDAVEGQGGQHFEVSPAVLDAA